MGNEADLGMGGAVGIPRRFASLGMTIGGGGVLGCGRPSGFLDRLGMTIGGGGCRVWRWV